MVGPVRCSRAAVWERGRQRERHARMPVSSLLADGLPRMIALAGWVVGCHLFSHNLQGSSGLQSVIYNLMIQMLRELQMSLG